MKSRTNATEDLELRKIISVICTLVVIEGRMREVIVDEHYIMCSIRPELGYQVCIDEHTANLIHDGEVESLGQSIRLRSVSFGNLMTHSLLG